MALVSSVAMIELAVGITIGAFLPPLGKTLIKMAVKDAWTAHRLEEEREFSLITYVVEKFARFAKKLIGELVPLWDNSFFAALRDAESVTEVETTVMKQLDELTLADVTKAVAVGGSWVALKLFFLYFEFGGLKEKIIQTIKESVKNYRPLPQTLTFLEDKNVLELWTTFHAIVTTVEEKDANAELQTWLKGLDQVELWCGVDSDDLKSVGWEALTENLEGKDEAFGSHILFALKDAVMQNADVYYSLASAKLLKEFKTHCLDLCLEVLSNCGFVPDEINLIRELLAQQSDGMAPASQIYRILDQEIWDRIDSQKLKSAREKLHAIKKASSDMLKNLT